jgi:hypothetical protein
MNALRHGSLSTIISERDFIARHLNEKTAEALNAELEPVRRERLIVLTALDCAISSDKSTAMNLLLRRLRCLARRERAIVQATSAGEKLDRGR